MIPIHSPIMAPEILSFFNLQPASIVADLTVGEGGHSSLMAPLIPRGRLLCLDRDPEILALARERLGGFANITFACDTYDNFPSVREAQNFPLFDAVLVDMGISMYHFKAAKRGFSFEDTSLDMRLSPSEDESAADLINHFSEAELADIFYYYGEEHASHKIAHFVVKNRPFLSAKELSDGLAGYLGRRGKAHPATKIFQALRIYVNKELEIAEKSLEGFIQNLAPGGILCILSFHSMEDRLVKNAFKDAVRLGKGQLSIVKPLEAPPAEQKSNPAARSAKLRVFQRS